MVTQEFTLPELQCKVMFHVKHGKQENTAERDVSRETISASPAPALLVVAGGRRPADIWLQAAALNRAVYAADRGGACCLANSIVPRALYGDCDSTTSTVYDELTKRGTRVQRFQPEKDDTDLQLLLKNLPAGDIVATGIWGGRFDHLFSNVYTLLGMKKQRNCQIIMADEKEFMLLLAAEETAELTLQADVEAVSLLPLSATAKVDFSGVHWPLAQAELKQLYPYAISNVPSDTGEKLCCTCHAGSLGLYIRWQA